MKLTSPSPNVYNGGKFICIKDYNFINGETLLNDTLIKGNIYNLQIINLGLNQFEYYFYTTSFKYACRFNFTKDSVNDDVNKNTHSEYLIPLTQWRDDQIDKILK